MAIGVSNTSSEASGAAKANSLTFSHAVSGDYGNRLLLVGVAKRDGVKAQNVTGITFGGVSLTKKSEIHYGTRETGVELWYLKNPTASTANIIVSMDVDCYLAAGGISFYNVDQTTIFNATVTTWTNISTSISNTLASAAGELVVDVAAKKYTQVTDGEMLAGANQTRHVYDYSAHATDSNNVTVGMSSEAGASTTTMSWSWTSGSRYDAQIIVALLNDDYKGGKVYRTRRGINLLGRHERRLVF